MYSTYTARDGVEYEYDANWNARTDGLTWSATVSCRGRVTFKPIGLFLGAHPEGACALVRQAVEREIEHRVCNASVAGNVAIAALRADIRQDRSC